MWFDQKHCMILSYVIPFHFILFLFHHTLLNNFPFFSFTVYVILCYAILFHFIPSLLYSIASYSTLMICCDIISYAKLRGCTPKKIGTSPRATRATTKQPQCSAVFWLGRSFFFRKAWKQTLIEATFTWFVYKMLRQSRKISNKKKDFPHCIESEFGAETFWGHHQLTNGMQSGWHSCMLTSSMLIHVLNPWICPSLAKQSDVHLTEINSASSKRSRRPKNGWTQRSQTQQPIVCVCDPLERLGSVSLHRNCRAPGKPHQTFPWLLNWEILRIPAGMSQLGRSSHSSQRSVYASAFDATSASGSTSTSCGKKRKSTITEYCKTGTEVPQQVLSCAWWLVLNLALALHLRLRVTFKIALTMDPCTNGTKTVKPNDCSVGTI